MARILIIEDDRDIQNITELILADAGHAVVRANDGLSGVELATGIQPDLILMDLALPQLDGWQATRQLKTHPETHHIPIIIFTAIVQLDEGKQAMSEGCDAIIIKPFEVEDLLEVITLVLAKHTADGQSAHEVGGF